MVTQKNKTKIVALGALGANKKHNANSVLFLMNLSKYLPKYVQNM